MKKKTIPDECSSLICDPGRKGKDHCPKCSHANFKGSCKIAGVIFSWDYSPRFGPTFNLDMPEGFKGYDKFDRWLEKYF